MAALRGGLLQWGEKMFELVLIVCLMTDAGEICTTSVSPKAAETEVCEAAGDWLARKLAWDIRASGGQARVGWKCQKKGEEV